MVRRRTQAKQGDGGQNSAAQASELGLAVENSGQSTKESLLSTIGQIAGRLCSHYNGLVPFTVRDFQPADFDTLWRLDQECFAPGISYSRTELKAYMRRRGSFTLVAEEATAAATSTGLPDSGKGAKHFSATAPAKALVTGFSVAGFIVAGADGRGHGHIITIDVIAAARRSGVGSLLLGAAEDRLRAARCSSVELETAVDNLSALSFYKRQGYSVIKTFPRYYSNGVDALVLEKDLGIL
jgi:[ribosomal protein S18]-alanine N-acetyltransferase